MKDDLFETVVVPIADQPDAATTARALQPYVGPEVTVIVVYVEKAGEAPDEALKHREELAEELYQDFLDMYEESPVTLQFLTLSGRDIPQTIIDGAADVDATLIAFTPRGITSWLRRLTGNPSVELITESEIPVLVLPKPSETFS